MDTRPIELFHAAIDAGSFAEAARRLDVDPSAVSRAIAGLERRLGVQLLARTTRSIRLTAAGERFAEDSRGALEMLEAASDRARRDSGALSGRIRLSASVAYGERVLMPILAPFLERHPDIDLIADFTDRTVDLVAEGIDLAVRLGPSRDSALRTRALHPVRHHVCATPAWIERWGSPATPSDLADHRCVCFDLPGYRDRWRFRRDGDTTSVRIAPAFRCSSAPGVLAAVHADLGPALLSDWLIGDALAIGALVELFPAYDVSATDFDASAHLLWPARPHLPVRVRALIDWLAEHLTAPSAPA